MNATATTTPSSSHPKSRTSRGAPLMRAVMRSFSHSKKREKPQPPQHQQQQLPPPSSSQDPHLVDSKPVDDFTTSTSSSHLECVELPQHTNDTRVGKGTPPLHPQSISQHRQDNLQYQTPEKKTLSYLHQSPITVMSCQSSSPNQQCQQESSTSTSSSSASKPSSSLHNILLLQKSISHEEESSSSSSSSSVDCCWTNATEATSFSEHDDTAVAATTATTITTTTTTITEQRLCTIADDDDDSDSDDDDESDTNGSCLEWKDSAAAAAAAGHLEGARKAFVKDGTVALTTSQMVMDSVSSTSSSSSTSFSFTCHTSQCALKVMQRDTMDVVCDDDNDDDQSWNDLPVVITLINDNVHNSDQEALEATTATTTTASTTVGCDHLEASMSPLTLLSPTKQQKHHQQQQHATEQVHSGGHETTSLRLERAEALLESYRSTVRSNEHLIESLEQTLLETRESAQDLWVERNRLEQELEETLDEQDALILSEKNCLMRRIHAGVLALSLLYYFVMGRGSEYVLIFVATVYLLEDVMTMSL